MANLSELTLWIDKQIDKKQKYINFHTWLHIFCPLDQFVYKKEIRKSPIFNFYDSDAIVKRTVFIFVSKIWYLLSFKNMKRKIFKKKGNWSEQDFEKENI